MKGFVVIFCLFLLVQCEDQEICTKGLTMEISKPATFIDMDLKVVSWSVDSVMLNTTFTNNGEKDFSIYRPLLPTDNFTEEILTVGVKDNFDQVKFLGHNQEAYLLNNVKEVSSYVDPRLDESRFIILKPHQTIAVQTNIANKFDFKSFIEKGVNHFFVSYMPSFPYVVNNKQILETDPDDQEMKPVYYYVDVAQEFNGDSSRIMFDVPSPQQSSSPQL
jgi:hypothetical protein